jgi:hypothetical protein
VDTTSSRGSEGAASGRQDPSNVLELTGLVTKFSSDVFSVLRRDEAQRGASCFHWTIRPARAARRSPRAGLSFGDRRQNNRQL